MKVVASAFKRSWWITAGLMVASLAAAIVLFDLLAFNTRIVISGAALLGVASGVVGTFMILRKQALVGDAVSHAMLPGVAVAFLVSVSVGGTGKTLPLLLLGATCAGVLGLGALLLITHRSPIKQDAALGIILSVFFGAGVSLLGVIQNLGQGHASGLETFIYGKAASMLPSDVVLIAGATLVILTASAVFFKELRLVCFDPGFADTQGISTLRLDMLLMGLVVLVMVVGLQAVGLILAIALLVIPAAAARFWTERLGLMIIWSGALGAISGAVGSVTSAHLSDVPSGAMIVLVAGLLFFVSMIAAPERGLCARVARQMKMRGKVRREHVLRAMYERLDIPSGHAVDNLEKPLTPQTSHARISELGAMRSWSERQLLSALKQTEREGLTKRMGQEVTFTPEGVIAAAQVVRNHRLWELYLIHFADTCPSMVDHTADAVEHVLSPELIRQIETLLPSAYTVGPTIPSSPHRLGPGSPSDKITSPEA